MYENNKVSLHKLLTVILGLCRHFDAFQLLVLILLRLDYIF